MCFRNKGRYRPMHGVAESGREFISGCIRNGAVHLFLQVSCLKRLPHPHIVVVQRIDNIALYGGSKVQKFMGIAPCVWGWST